MRLWPYQMLDVLPTRQLVGQWRECLAVAGMYSRGEINHATINKVADFPVEHIAVYCTLVREEFARREFTIGTNTIEKLNNDINYENITYDLKISEDGLIYVNGDLLFDGYHNERNIKQCLYGFQERYDIGIIKEEEWIKLHSKFKNLIEF